MDMYLSVDVGGTSIKLGMVDDEGYIRRRASFSTRTLNSQFTANQILYFIKNLDILGVGLAVPGPVSPEGELLMLPNVDSAMLEVISRIQNELESFPVALVNDANAAALGELWKGAGEGAQDLIFITLGTGVGAGVVQAGKLVVGAHGAGGEVGHLTMEYGKDAPLCGCGKRGCLERYASATGLVSLYKQEAEELHEEIIALDNDSDSKSVFEAAEKGSRAAQNAITRAMQYLGRALAQLGAVMDPEVYVIGGGMSAGFEDFIPYLEKAYTENALKAVTNTPIKQAVLGNDAGMIGAAYFVKTALEK